MEIKTTKEIAEVHNKYNSKDTELFMKCVAVDDLIEWIENFEDVTAFNNWQIRKTTLIKHITNK